MGSDNSFALGNLSSIPNPIPSRKRSYSGERLEMDNKKIRKLDSSFIITSPLYTVQITYPTNYNSKLPEEQQIAGWVIKYMRQIMLWLHIQSTLDSEKCTEIMISTAIENSLESIPEVIPNLRTICKDYALRNMRLFEDYVGRRASTTKFAELFVDSLVKDVTTNCC